MARLNATDLLDLVIDSMERGGNTVSVVSESKPFEIRVTPPNGKTCDFTIFIWNCTHGGGAARAPDEFRVQFTGAMPSKSTKGITLILGWHDDYGVFAAWDIEFHDGQDSISPSAQIRQEALFQARTTAFAVSLRKNGELAIAFEPDLLYEYAVNSKQLHNGEKTLPISDILGSLPDVGNEVIDEIENPERKEVVSTIVRKYRAADFRRRVLSAYGHRCAVCGVQLDLLDAAHIEPVGEPTSTDETTNGISLCALHHRAYDKGLISFDKGLRVLISSKKIDELNGFHLLGGLKDFRKMLREVILLPADKRDYPNPDYIVRGNKCRMWQD